MKFDRTGCLKYFLGFIFLLIVSEITGINLFIILISIIIIYLSIQVVVFGYFNGINFLLLKESVKSHIQNCNDLNSHIEDLKKSYIDIQASSYGYSRTIDSSIYNFKRREWQKIQRNRQVYNCSLSICRNAAMDPFKYLCKYFNITPNDKTLNMFSEVFNDFSSAEEGKRLLITEREQILDKIYNKIPFVIHEYFNRKLIKNLGFHEVDLSRTYFPTFSFQYVSAGGNSSTKSDIVFDLDNLNEFIKYLNNKIEFTNSVKGQRSLMSNNLRQIVKNRDGHCCRLCGNGTHIEPNLLLEIDHIIPVSKGGLTNLENLQTLCWRCNRSKGAKFQY